MATKNNMARDVQDVQDVQDDTTQGLSEELSKNDINASSKHASACDHCKKTNHASNMCFFRPKCSLKLTSKCTFCNGSGHTANACRKNPANPPSGQFCGNCKMTNHTTDTCHKGSSSSTPSGKFCANCNMFNHNTENCTKHAKPRPLGKYCIHCSMTNHTTEACFKKPSATGACKKPISPSGSKFCTFCSKDGHDIANCVLSKAKSAEKASFCKFCEIVGHDTDKCTKFTRHCVMCGQTGHLGRNCGNPTGNGKYFCLSCGRDTHSFERCPKKSNKM